MKNDYCRICDRLGKKLNVDYLEGEKLPPEFHELKRFIDTYEGDVVFKCPLCNQAYLYSHNWDNDIFNQLDYAFLTQIDDMQVLEFQNTLKIKEQEQKKEINKIWNRFKKKYGNELNQLSTEEMKVIEYLKQKHIYGEYIEKIAQDLSYNREMITNIVNKLYNKDLILKNIYWPMHPNEHNFQVELKDEDPFVYTKININYL